MSGLFLVAPPVSFTMRPYGSKAPYGNSSATTTTTTTSRVIDDDPGSAVWTRCLKNAERVRAINVASKRLTWVPEEIGACQRLVHLDMKLNNLLNSLPATFGLLGALTDLHLGGCCFTTLPACLGQLNHLRRLHLNNNALESLDPKTIAGMVGLTTLNVAHNKLSHLPEVLGLKLQCLEHLRLDGNALTLLPDSLGKLAALRVLSASGNLLESLPSSTIDLNRLEELHLIDNRFAAVPAWLHAGCTRLRLVDLSLNQLHYVTPELTLLGRRLKCLYLDRNPWSEPVRGGGHLTCHVVSLRELALRRVAVACDTGDLSEEKHVPAAWRSAISSASSCAQCGETLIVSEGLHTVRYQDLSDLAPGCQLRTGELIAPVRYTLCSYACFKADDDKEYHGHGA